MKLKTIHTVQAGNEVPHKKGVCEQCDNTRIWIKKDAHEKYHLGFEDFPKRDDCEYCKNE